MVRIIKPGSRPIVAFGVMFGIIFVLPILIAVQGNWSVAVQIAGILILGYALLGAYALRQRILVSDDSIAFRTPLGRELRIPFSEIDISIAPVVAEPGHPVALEIYRNRNERPALKIPLKSFRHADVNWLLDLPQLKLQA